MLRPAFSTSISSPILFGKVGKLQYTLSGRLGSVNLMPLGEIWKTQSVAILAPGREGWAEMRTCGGYSSARAARVKCSGRNRVPAS